MFKSQNIHNLYFCCSRCNSLTFMLDYDQDFKRFKSKLFTKLTTGALPHGLGHGQYPTFCRYPKCMENIVIVGWNK